MVSRCDLSKRLGLSLSKDFFGWIDFDPVQAGMDSVSASPLWRHNQMTMPMLSGAEPDTTYIRLKRSMNLTDAYESGLGAESCQ
jgi:hypothetical protein